MKARTSKVPRAVNHSVANTASQIQTARTTESANRLELGERFDSTIFSLRPPPLAAALGSTRLGSETRPQLHPLPNYFACAKLYLCRHYHHVVPTLHDFAFHALVPRCHCFYTCCLNPTLSQDSTCLQTLLLANKGIITSKNKLP